MHQKIKFIPMKIHKTVVTRAAPFGPCEVSRVRVMLLMSVAYNFFCLLLGYYSAACLSTAKFIYQHQDSNSVKYDDY